MTPQADGRFPTTHWTLIARLKSSDAAEARRALDDLVAQYHFPLYCVIRRRGLAHHDAEDALHDFLAKLLRLETLADANVAKGRLRAFLATALTRFLSNWHRDRAAQAREVSIDAPLHGEEDERRYRHERFPDHETPERLFDRQWARELLTRVLHQLEAQYAERGKSAVFAALAPVLQRGGSLREEDAPALAATLGLNASMLRTRLHRFLKDYRVLLEAEVFQTVASRDEIEAEIAHLQGSFRKS
jgi:DNA-directed RNA polymerase specialized sigma24 family protein